MEAGQDSAFGTWNHPTLPLSIRYSLAVFNEIDFLVGEGYRRIPHGGIEHGGLLFGRTSPSELEIDAFRQIEAEHASGPAFVLSEGDLLRVNEQLRSAANDLELSGLEPIGLFISHARRELQIEEAERQLLDSLLPKSPRLLVLLKPEKFKPTRFAFIFPNEAELNIFTLPSPVRPRRAKKKPAETRTDEPGTAQTTPAEKPRTRRSPRKAPLIALSEALGEPIASTAPSPQPEPLPPVEKQPEPAVVPAQRLNWPLVIAAAAVSAVVLAGCFLYFDWNFLAPPIELHASPSLGRRVTVSWLPRETAGTNEANLHIWSNDVHATVPLSAAERNAGQVNIDTAGNDVTVELIAHHWLHDRRGVLRVLTNK